MMWTCYLDIAGLISALSYHLCKITPGQNWDAPVLQNFTCVHTECICWSFCLCAGVIKQLELESAPKRSQVM